MKKTLLSVFLIGALLLSIFTTPAAAANMRTSEQVARYYTRLVPNENGKFGIVFFVYGTNEMEKIGAEKIQIYEQAGSRWTLVETFDSSTDGMYATDKSSFSNTLYYNGKQGSYYQVVITIFAENSAGTDSRTDTLYITA